MTSLSNFHNDDTRNDGAWKQATLALGLMTVVTVIAIMVFASTRLSRAIAESDLSGRGIAGFAGAACGERFLVLRPL